MGYLRVTCLNCGCEFNISADEISSKTEYCCPECKLKMDSRLWRRLRAGFFTMEEVADRLSGQQMVEVRMFKSQYMPYEYDLPNF